MLQPEPVRFISYPYEWCFGQLRDAALLTLEIQERALVRGITLRDASAYNIQYRGTAPVVLTVKNSVVPWSSSRDWMSTSGLTVTRLRGPLLPSW